MVGLAVRYSERDSTRTTEAPLEKVEVATVVDEPEDDEEELELLELEVPVLVDEADDAVLVAPDIGEKIEPWGLAAARLAKAMIDKMFALNCMFEMFGYDMTKIQEKKIGSEKISENKQKKSKCL